MNPQSLIQRQKPGAKTSLSSTGIRQLKPVGRAGPARRSMEVNARKPFDLCAPSGERHRLVVGHWQTRRGAVGHRALPSSALRPRSSESGVALLLTLAMIVLLALLIFGLVASMRTERETARAYNEETKVRWIADMALQDALAHLAAATPPITTTNTWIAAPGLIYRAQPGLLASDPLYNANTDKSNLVDAADMQNNHNLNGLVCGVNATYSAPGYNYFTDWASQSNKTFYGQRTGAYITPGWVNIGENGNLPGSTNANGTTNAIVGRYTYWMDPESCKVNLNLAGSRNPTNANQSLPADLALRGLGGVFATDAIVTNFVTASLRSTSRQLTTPEEMRVANSTWTGLYWDQFSSNKFSVTTYGADPNVDAFGRARVNLRDITSDTSAAYNTALARFGEALYADVLYTNLAASTRKSFQAKYGAFGAKQILANIVDYQKPVTALPTHDSLDAQAIPTSYCGLKKGPLIENVIVHVATNAVDAGGGTNNLVVHTFVDLKFVNGYEVDRGLGWAVKTEPLYVLVNHSGAAVSSPTTNALPAVPTSMLVSNVPANRFRLLSQVAGGTPPEIQTVITGTGGVPPIASSVVIGLKSVRLLTQDGNDYICDWMAPADFNALYLTGMNFAGSNIVPYVAGTTPQFNADPPSLGVSMPLALGKHDPRVRTFASGPSPSLTTNWFALGPADIKPTGTDSYSSRLAPEQYNLLADTRAIPNGAVAVSHAYLINQIAEAPFQSVGELGHIHTGYPWRTIRLRSVYPETTGTNSYSATQDAALNGPNYGGIGDPNTGRETVETSALPDWVMLDMFTATNATSVAGRINLNNQFANAAVSVSVPARISPLAALLYNTSTGINANVDLIASNIANRVFVTNSPYASLPAYLTPGQICEASGLGFYSDVAWHPSSADREQAIRRIGNLITTRSDVFTIWILAEYVRDLGQDGTFDWEYGIKYRFWQPLAWAQSNVHANVDSNWWAAKVLNTTNVRNVLVDGDGNGKLDMDEIIGRVRIQAVVQRDATDPLRPTYRLLYTRQFPEK